MAKGTASKQEVAATILEAFGDKAFLYNDGKEIRVNCIENGEPVQIKIALTAAKVAVEPGADNAMSGTGLVKNDEPPFPAVGKRAEVTKIEASTEEKEAVAALMKELGI